MPASRKKRAPDTTDIRRLAKTLKDHGVEYAVIGCMLMTKQTTRDTDIPDRQRLRQLRDALRAVRGAAQDEP